jgi:hypothetical protein
MWKGEPTKTRQLLRRESYVPAEEVVWDRCRSAFLFRRTQWPSFDCIWRGLPEWAMQQPDNKHVIDQFNSTNLSSLWNAALHHGSHNAMYLFQIYPSPIGVPVCAQTLVGSPGKTVVQI